MREVGTQQFRSITNSFLRARNEKLENDRGTQLKHRRSFAFKTETGRSNKTEMTSWRAEDMITNRFEAARKIGGESFFYRSGLVVRQQTLAERS
jgi:hypothetical protein